jgi:type IX secretion system PorP/SprF family membrane protein
MRKYLFGLCSGLILCFCQNAIAQDIHFSQFPEISTLRNPALTGIFSGDFKIGMDYRNQWSAVSSNPYNTFALAGETRILVDRNAGDYLSFGLDITYDKAGSIGFTSTEIYPALCFNKSMEDEHNTYLSIGMTGGYFNRSVDMSKMTFTSQYQYGGFAPGNGSGENVPFNSLHNYDLGTGVSINSSFDLEGVTNYYIGAALYHLNHPTEVFYGSDNLVKLPLKWEFNTGFHVNIGRQFGLTFHGNYSLQDPYSEAIFGGLLSWHNSPIAYPSNFTFSLGCYVRYNDAVIPTVKLDFSNVSIGVSYDATNSQLGTSVPGTGATEFTLFIKGKYNHKKNPRDNVMCPKFDEQVYNSFR